MNSVGWFEIYVDEMDRAKKFYEEVFKIKLEKLENPATLEQGIKMFSFPGNMHQYGANGALVQMPGFKSGANSVIIYFACENCEVEQSRVIDAGGVVFKSKFSIGEYGFISLIHDTENNLIGLHSMN
jgi:uncharacterized protein